MSSEFYAAIMHRQMAEKHRCISLLHYNLHHVCVCMGHAVFSEATTVTNFW